MLFGPATEFMTLTGRSRLTFGKKNTAELPRARKRANFSPESGLVSNTLMTIIALARHDVVTYNYVMRKLSVTRKSHRKRAIILRRLPKDKSVEFPASHDGKLIARYSVHVIRTADIGTFFLKIQITVIVLCFRESRHIFHQLAERGYEACPCIKFETTFAEND